MVSTATAALWASIPTLLGIVATVVAWKLNPKRKLYDELDRIFRDLEELQKVRDEALKNNDSDRLTVVTSGINILRKRKADLLQRLR